MKLKSIILGSLAVLFVAGIGYACAPQCYGDQCEVNVTPTPEISVEPTKEPEETPVPTVEPTGIPNVPAPTQPNDGLGCASHSCNPVDTNGNPVVLEPAPFSK